ncbi:hypothetical protein ACV229_15640 [Burkholderia sp. MR1-5-21]
MSISMMNLQTSGEVRQCAPKRGVGSISVKSGGSFAEHLFIKLPSAPTVVRRSKNHLRNGTPPNHSPLDEPLQHAHSWLHERRVLIPADRKLPDRGSSIWMDVEHGLLALVEATVMETLLVHAGAVPSAQHGTFGMGVPEWLKMPPARRSPTTLIETLEKVTTARRSGRHALLSNNGSNCSRSGH